MIQVRRAAYVQEAPSIARRSKDGGRWPFLQTALFVVLSSGLLWGLIIALVRWLSA